MKLPHLALNFEPGLVVQQMDCIEFFFKIGTPALFLGALLELVHPLEQFEPDERFSNLFIILFNLPWISIVKFPNKWSLERL